MILSWLTSKVAMIGGAVLAIGLVFLKIFGMGKKSARQEIAAKTTDTVIKVTKDVKKVREDVDRLDDDELSGRLRKQRKRHTS